MGRTYPSHLIEKTGGNSCVVTTTIKTRPLPSRPGPLQNPSPNPPKKLIRPHLSSKILRRKTLRRKEFSWEGEAVGFLRTRAPPLFRK